MVLTLYDAAILVQKKKKKKRLCGDSPHKPPISSHDINKRNFLPAHRASPVPRMPPNLYSPSCPPLYDTDSNESNKRLKENI
jgi:hypothetical protein